MIADNNDQENCIIGHVSWSPDYGKQIYPYHYPRDQNPESRIPERDFDKDAENMIKQAKAALKIEHMREFAYKNEQSDKTTEYYFNVAGFTEDEIEITVERLILEVYVACPVVSTGHETFYKPQRFSYGLESTENIDKIALNDGVLSITTSKNVKTKNNKYKVGYARRE